MIQTDQIKIMMVLKKVNKKIHEYGTKDKSI